MTTKRANDGKDIPKIISKTESRKAQVGCRTAGMQNTDIQKEPIVAVLSQTILDSLFVLGVDYISGYSRKERHKEGEPILGEKCTYCAKYSSAPSYIVSLTSRLVIFLYFIHTLNRKGSFFQHQFGNLVVVSM